MARFRVGAYQAVGLLIRVVDQEVPWQNGTRTDAAPRAQWLSLLVEHATVPECELIDPKLTASERSAVGRDTIDDAVIELSFTAELAISATEAVKHDLDERSSRRMTDMDAWLRTVPTPVLRRAEDLAVSQAQRHVEADRLRDAVQEYRIAQVFGSELDRREKR